jgi:hypothetical protein
MIAFICRVNVFKRQLNPFSSREITFAQQEITFARQQNGLGRRPTAIITTLSGLWRAGLAPIPPANERGRNRPAKSRTARS